MIWIDLSALLFFKLQLRLVFKTRAINHSTNSLLWNLPYELLKSKKLLKQWFKFYLLLIQFKKVSFLIFKNFRTYRFSLSINVNEIICAIISDIGKSHSWQATRAHNLVSLETFLWRVVLVKKRNTVM